MSSHILYNFHISVTKVHVKSMHLHLSLYKSRILIKADIRDIILYYVEDATILNTKFHRLWLNQHKPCKQTSRQGIMLQYFKPAFKVFFLNLSSSNIHFIIAYVTWWTLYWSVTYIQKRTDFFCITGSQIKPKVISDGWSLNHCPTRTTTVLPSNILS